MSVSWCQRHVFCHSSRVYKNVLFNFCRFKGRKAPARKPWWAPTAQSKIFRIPEHQPVVPEEMLELRNLYARYRTTVRSIT